MRDGEALLETFVNLADPAVVERIGTSGSDFAVIDLEHGPLGFETLSDLQRAADATSLDLIVRLPDDSHASILRSLDVGSSGVQVPMIETGRRARELVAKAHYPPRGRRALSLSNRAINSGATPARAHVDASDPLVIAHIETGIGVTNVDDIAATTGLDVPFLGPTDLSLSLGVLGQTGTAPFEAAREAILAACRMHAVTAGTMASDAGAARRALDHGFRYLIWGTAIGRLGAELQATRDAWRELSTPR